MKKLLLLLCIVFYSNTLFSAAAANPSNEEELQIPTEADIAAVTALEELPRPQKTRKQIQGFIDYEKREINKILRKLKDDSHNEALQETLKKRQENLTQQQQNLERLPKRTRQPKQEKLQETILTHPDPETVATARKELEKLQRMCAQSQHFRENNRELISVTRFISRRNCKIQKIEAKLNVDQENKDLLEGQLTQLNADLARLNARKKELESQKKPTRSGELEDAAPPADELFDEFEDDDELEDDEEEEKEEEYGISLFQADAALAQPALLASAAAAIPATPEQLAAAAQAAQLVRLDDDFEPLPAATDLALAQASADGQAAQFSEENPLEPMPAATGLEAAQALAPVYAFPPDQTFAPAYTFPPGTIIFLPTSNLFVPDETFPPTYTLQRQLNPYNPPVQSLPLAGSRPQAAVQSNPEPKQYICPHCRASYKQRINFATHIQTHRQPK